MAHSPEPDPSVEEPTHDLSRRGFIERAAGLAMGITLVASYGTFAALAARFMYPAHDRRTTWLYVADLGRFPVGHSLKYSAPTGEPIAIARKADTGTVNDFVALSSTCPHLGCQVHWQGAQNRFFCPCHNGVFTPDGIATEGPPAAAKQVLAQYPLRIEGNLLFIEVPTEGLSS